MQNIPGPYFSRGQRSNEKLIAEGGRKAWERGYCDALIILFYRGERGLAPTLMMSVALNTYTSVCTVGPAIVRLRLDMSMPSYSPGSV